MANEIDKTRELLTDMWDGDYYLIAAGEQAPTKNEVMEFAKKYGVTFPDDYIVHATGDLGGFFIEVKESLWPYPEGLAVAPFWEFLRGVYSYAYSDEVPEWMNISIAAKYFKELGHQVIPVFKIWADPDVYCYDQEGQLLKYIYEENSFVSIDKGWFALIEEELKELAARKNRKLNKSIQANPPEE